jgi:SEL1 protein
MFSIFLLLLMTAAALYETGLGLLNATRPNRLEAYKVISKAANLGHDGARLKVAWAQLLGNADPGPIPRNTVAAYQTFVELSEKGMPDAQMVCQKLNNWLFTD